MGQIVRERAKAAETTKALGQQGHGKQQGWETLVARPDRTPWENKTQGLRPVPNHTPPGRARRMPLLHITFSPLLRTYRSPHGKAYGTRTPRRFAARATPQIVRASTCLWKKVQ